MSGLFWASGLGQVLFFGSRQSHQTKSWGLQNWVGLSLFFFLKKIIYKSCNDDISGKTGTRNSVRLFELFEAQKAHKLKSWQFFVFG